MKLIFPQNVGNLRYNGVSCTSGLSILFAFVAIRCQRVGDLSNHLATYV
jgi:hypothetical protein